MSYDPTTFLGLAAGGSTYAPAGSHPTYEAAVTGADSDGHWIGPNHRCPEFGPGLTFLGVEVDPVDCPSRYADATDIYRDPADMTSVGDAFGDAPPAAYMTVFVEWGDAGVGGLRNIVGLEGAYSTACINPGTFGPECDGFIPIEYQLKFENYLGANAGTFVPDDVFGDGSLIADGNTRMLQGYLKPPTTVYTGDSANTASDLLWAASDVGTLHAWIDDVEFHAQEIEDTLRFTIRPFWTANQSFVCLV